MYARQFLLICLYNANLCVGGGNGAFAVFNDGYQPGDPTGSAQIKIPSATPGPSTDGSSPSSSQTLVVSTALVTQSGGQTVPTVIRVTETAQASSPSGGSNKVAIAVGIVIAVVAVAAVVGALFFWMRHRKNKAIEEERSRHQMMTNLVTGEKPGSSYSMGDSRLDQSVMFQRRQSDGSIADNEDYSRRILKVKALEEYSKYLGSCNPAGYKPRINPSINHHLPRHSNTASIPSPRLLINLLCTTVPIFFF